MPMIKAVQHIWLMIAISCLTTGTRTISAAGLKQDQRFAPDCNSLLDNERTSVAHPLDTQSYWVCENGRPTLKHCNERERFNKKSSSCVPYLRSSLLRSASTDEENTFVCPEKGIHRFVLEGSCTKYISCLSGSYSIQSCANDLHFDSVRLGCNFKDKAMCDRDWCPLKDSVDSIVTRPSSKFCEEFYVCSDGHPELFHCLNGLHWHQAIQDCDFPIKAKCEIAPPKDPEDTPPPPPPPAPTCRPGQGVYTFPHPTNCNEFYLCVGDVEAYHRVCAPDMIFNPTLGECERTGNFVCPHNRY